MGENERNGRVDCRHLRYTSDALLFNKLKLHPLNAENCTRERDEKAFSRTAQASGS